MQAGQVWTTKDYFDPWPGFYAGLAQRQANQSDQRMAADQQERATRERERQTEAKAIAEQRDMQQARALAEMNVDPVRNPDGSVDWKSTGMAARQRKELGMQASTLGRLHAVQGGPTSLTQEEYALSQLPEYQQAYRIGTVEKAERDAKQAAELEQIGLRTRGSLEVAQERNRVPEAMATVREEMDDGTVVTRKVPSSQLGAIEQNAGPGDATANKWKSVIESIQRFEQAGIPIDVDYNDQGFPTVSKSWMNHDASPKDKGSYQRLITEFMKRAGKSGAAPVPAGAAPAGGSKPMIVIPR